MSNKRPRAREWQQHVKSSINVFVVLDTHTHSSGEFIPPALFVPSPLPRPFSGANKQRSSAATAAAAAAGIGPTYSTLANLTLICFYFRVIAAHNHSQWLGKVFCLLEKDLLKTFNGLKSKYLHFY